MGKSKIDYTLGLPAVPSDKAQKENQKTEPAARVATQSYALVTPATGSITLHSLEESKNLSDPELLALFGEDVRAYYQEGKNYITEHLEEAQKVNRYLQRFHHYRLYLIEYKSFEEFCTQVLHISVSRAYQLIESYNTTEILQQSLPIGTPLPTNEGQRRALAGMKPEQQKEVWEKTLEEAQETDQKITAKLIQKTRKKLLPPPEEEEEKQEISQRLPTSENSPKNGPEKQNGNDSDQGYVDYEEIEGKTPLQQAITRFAQLTTAAPMGAVRLTVSEEFLKSNDLEALIGLLEENFSDSPRYYQIDYETAVSHRLI